MTNDDTYFGFTGIELIKSTTHSIPGIVKPTHKRTVLVTSIQMELKQQEQTTN